MHLGRVGIGSEGVGRQDLVANTKLRHSTFSLAVEMPQKKMVLTVTFLQMSVICQFYRENFNRILY